MNKNYTFTEVNFEKMNWHDSRFYSISFPNKSLEIILDIDYIISFNDKNKIFEILPSKLVFYDVSNFKINLDFNNTIGIDISEIRRQNKTVLSNKRTIIWEYIIETDHGTISFNSTGYSQSSDKLPIWSPIYELGRE